MLYSGNSSYETLQKKHGLMQYALMTLNKNSEAVKAHAVNGLFAQAEKIRSRMAEEADKTEEVTYLPENAKMSAYFSDMEYTCAEEMPDAILESEDGVYHISENLQTDSVKLDLSFLELVNSVLH